MDVIGDRKATLGEYVTGVMAKWKRKGRAGDLFMLAVDFQQRSFKSKENDLASTVRIASGNIITNTLSITVQGEEYFVVAFVLGNNVHYKSVVKVGRFWHMFDPLAGSVSVILSTIQVKKHFSFKELHKENCVGAVCPECIFFAKRECTEREYDE